MSRMITVRNDPRRVSHRARDSSIGNAAPSFRTPASSTGRSCAGAASAGAIRSRPWASTSRRWSGTSRAKGVPSTSSGAWPKTVRAPRFHDTMSPSPSAVTTASTADSVMVRNRSSLSRRRFSRSATAVVIRLKVAARSPISSR